jgi:hypothetical protein
MNNRATFSRMAAAHPAMLREKNVVTEFPPATSS